MLNHLSRASLARRLMRDPRGQAIAAFLLFSALSLGLVLSLSLNAPLNHDEHPFVASGTELVRHKLLPYRDFGYFHMPNLGFVDAALYRFNDHLLLTARLFSALCGWLTVLTTSAMVWRLFHRISAAAAHCARQRARDRAGIDAGRRRWFGESTGLVSNRGGDSDQSHARRSGEDGAGAGGEGAGSLEVISAGIRSGRLAYISARGRQWRQAVSLI